MARYQMPDGTVVDTDKASKSWEEAQYNDGRNMISRATGSQWHHETLYRSRRGRYYIEHTSNYQGSHDSAEWISEQKAAAWLLLMEEEIPGDLAKFAEEVSE